MVVSSSGDDHFLRLAEHIDADILELDAKFLADHLAARQHCNVLEHRLAPIAEAGRLDGSDLQAAAELVHHERSERLAFDILRHNEQRPSRLNDGFQQRQHRLKPR